MNGNLRHKRCFAAAIIPVLFAVISVAPVAGCADEDQPTLVVVDRSLDKDGLYQCTLFLPKDHPVDSLVLILYDRDRKKCGEVSLASPTPFNSRKIVFFMLNHEMVKHSVLQLHSHPLDDERHMLTKFVVGEQGAVRKENGKTVKISIE